MAKPHRTEIPGPLHSGSVQAVELVFLLLLHEYRLATLAALFSRLVIVLRLLWMFYLEESRREDVSEFQEIYDDLAGHYRHRLAAVSGLDDPENALPPEHRERHARLLRDLLRVERQTAVRLRNQGRISDETLRQIGYELDLREAHPSVSV